jgi:hypothetical protein
MGNDLRLVWRQRPVDSLAGSGGQQLALERIGERWGTTEASVARRTVCAELHAGDTHPCDPSSVHGIVHRIAPMAP